MAKDLTETATYRLNQPRGVSVKIFERPLQLRIRDGNQAFNSVEQHPIHGCVYWITLVAGNINYAATAGITHTLFQL